MGGGRSWHPGHTVVEGGGGVTDSGFPTATQGVAVEGYPSIGRHLYMTINSGRSWFHVRF